VGILGAGFVATGGFGGLCELDLSCLAGLKRVRCLTALSHVDRLSGSPKEPLTRGISNV